MNGKVPGKKGGTVPDMRFENNTKMLFNSKIDIDIAYNQSKFDISDDTSDFMMMQIRC